MRARSTLSQMLENELRASRQESPGGGQIKINLPQGWVSNTEFIQAVKEAYERVFRRVS